MSINNLTWYQFSNEYGITGTLATDPIFAKTKKGNTYAKFVIYCKATDNTDEMNEKNKSHSTNSGARELPLIAYVKVFNENLLANTGTLQKGYFVNFRYNNLAFVLGEDEETHELLIKASFVANDFKVRHIPKKVRAKNLEHQDGNNEELVNN